jgi:two-component system, chemotaxis family, CheB/CheR fusion protein
MEQIGPLLSDLLKGIAGMPEKVDDPLRDLLTLVSQRANMDFRDYKSSTILRRISRRMAVVHAHNLHDYTDFLRGHPEEVAELVKAFLINVTGFFRDRDAFEFLKDFVVPELVERGRENGRVLRAWSAGCSTGEEAYSIAIVIAEVLGSEISEWNIKIFATDLDDEAVGFARRGFYPGKLLDALPDGFSKRYFERIDHGYRVSKSLRQMVIFGSQDLTRGIPFPRMDLVVCRNLLIYLKPELQQEILDLFAYSLHQSNGYLFLGKAETARPSKATFDMVNKKWKVYRCLNGPLTLPSQGKAMTVARTGEWQRINRRIEAAERSEPLQDITPLRRLNDIMFRYLPIGIAVIDRNYRIITVNAVARRLLGVRDLAAEQDFLHTARGLPYTEVRQAIDAAFNEHSTATLSDLETDNATGRFLSLTIMPANFDDGGLQLAIITVSDVTEIVVTKRRLEDLQTEQTKTLEELGTSNKRLTSMNAELQEANEELQSANEELMLTQEELQATNEEFEATNEELQATNEELETNNEELQATNEELQTTNDELTSRSNELQETARELSSARERLRYMVQQFPYYVMIARGPKLEVEAFSARYALLFGEKDPKETPIEKVFSGDGVEVLIAAAKEALANGTTVKTKQMAAHVPNDEAIGSQFVHILIPIPAESGKTDGVIIFTENVSERASE